jgi:hypothetical protein
MSNLPPGVTEGMIPGNRPWDIEIEKLFDELDGMIVTFLNDSEIVGKADIPQVLRDLLTQYERELLEQEQLLDNGRSHGTSPTMGECDCDECQRYDYLFNQQSKLVNRCRFCGAIPEDCECSRGGSRFLDTADMNREEP